MTDSSTPALLVSKSIPRRLLRPAVRYLRKRAPRLMMELKRRFFPGDFETEMWLLPALCEGAKLALDIGANVGDFSYSMAKYVPQVITFEPNPRMWPQLKGLMGRRLNLEKVALSNQPGRADLFIGGRNDALARIGRDGWAPASWPSESVELRTLDSYHYDDVDFIKIDVEGHEELVVDGAMETIRRSRPVMLIECEERHNPGGLPRVLERFSGLDYHVFFIKDRALHDVAELNTEDGEFHGTRSGYINNFIFLPSRRLALREGLTRSLQKSGGRLK